jgi:predicted CopG family antitoxin
MGTRTVRLDEDLYERIAARKRDDETFSEAIERLVGGPSLHEFRGLFSEEEVETVEAAIAEKSRRSKERLER